MVKEKGNAIIEKDYFTDLNKIKETIRNNQNKAMVVVNRAMIMSYYERGVIINQRKVWGVINMLEKEYLIISMNKIAFLGY